MPSPQAAPMVGNDQSVDPHGAIIHQFLTQHPVGRAIAAHTGYGPGHPKHDAHARAVAQGGQVQHVSPTLSRTPAGPINPALLQQLMASNSGQAGPGGPPLPLPGGPGGGMPPPAISGGPGGPPGGGGPPMPMPSTPPPMPGR